MWSWKLGITFHVSLHMIWGYLGPISPNCPNTWVPSQTSFDVKWGTEVLGLLFVCPFAWFGLFRPSFPKLLQYSSTWETGITQPTQALDTRVISHLMWNKKLKTLDYFSCQSSQHTFSPTKNGIKSQLPLPPCLLFCSPQRSKYPKSCGETCLK